MTPLDAFLSRQQLTRKGRIANPRHGVLVMGRYTIERTQGE